MVLSNIGPKKLIAYEVYFVPTDSMVPAIFPGEVTLVDTSKNAIEDKGVGDIVAFSAIPEGLVSDVWIKRITVISQDAFDASGDNILSSIAEDNLKNLPLNRILGVGISVIGKLTSKRFTLCYRNLR